MTDSLHILHGDELVGRIDYERKRDAISLHYEDEWRFGAGGFPVSVAKSEVLKIGDMKVLNVERYDRLPDAAGVRVARLHQEDVCQALGHLPNSKYESEGGPSASDVVRLLRAESSNFEEDVSRFVMALAINWVIYGSDAHSKNYSLIHVLGSYLRLAPLYDIASNLPYEGNPKSRKHKLAMKVGGDYQLHRIARKS